MPRRAPEELPNKRCYVWLGTSELVAVEPTSSTKNLRLTGKTPINNDVIDVERVAKELTTALPFRHYLHPIVCSKISSPLDVPHDC